MHIEPSTLSDYVAVFRRRKVVVILVAVLIAALSLTLAIVLPPVYEASAVIRVEQQGIPDDIVRTTVNTYVDEQLDIVRNRVVTKENIEKIIRTFKLYENEWETQTMDDLVDRTIAHVTVEPESAEFPDPRTGRELTVTIRFTVLYEAEDAKTAQIVPNALADLFLKENAASRTEMAAAASQFLSEQATALQSEIAKLEGRIAEFKQENTGRLPELSDLNLRLMESTERDLRDTQERIRSVNQQQIYLQGELALVSPNAPTVGLDGKPVLSPPERLKVLQSEYASKTGIYGPQHPDLVRMRKEIESLSVQLGGSAGGSGALQSQLAVERDRLAALRERYSAEHPDVKKLGRTVSTLEARLREAAIANVAIASLSAPADNPSYIQLKARVEATTSELRMLTAQEVQLRAKLREYEDRLTATPQVEREYQVLVREHEGAVSEYNKIKAKQREAELAERLERTNKGERYSLVQSASLPSAPARPPRLLIALFGCVLGGAFGTGAGFLVEAVDRTVRGAKAVASLVQAPLLAVIPYIENSGDRRRRAVRRALSGVAVGLLIISGLAFYHLSVTPLDVAWSNAVERLTSTPNASTN